MANANSLSNQHDTALKGVLDKQTPVYDITPFSALDYPDHLSAIIWFAGCNMRCSYCYNGDIVFSKGRRSLDEVLGFLQKRVGLLEGVVLSGGEATMFSGLTEFCRKIKALGFKIKLDTNGTYPEKIKELIDEHLLDYVALDYKAPQAKFYAITKNKNFSDFDKSLALLLKESVCFEVRTTLHSDLLNVEDINEIAHDLEQRGYSGTYYIQDFIQDVTTIGEIANPQTDFDKNKVVSKLPIEYR
ncbi:MAG: anaerobic ribonucleoside-triphosphate reductase activating protein [Helicobacteraceae bacterium]|jgi:pyruvate formate lyase activating enzyme|nr:anaerobic ribonucleoside-triphosphate reductase activating protein [Helicobacteraceae bacterium]